ncbi:MAG: TatD family hydrolase [Muribaculaceae bacterium]|nr:TatD family hydrolase [Muribaculaceae bacterium]
MRLFDTHTHLYLPEFGEEGDLAVKRALDAGVSMMMLPNVDCTTVKPLMAMHSRFPDNTLMAMGLHPTEIGENPAEALFIIKETLYSNPSVFSAVGEVGMDLYWDASHRDEQMDVFEHQCRWALDLGLPVIIHCREGLDETLEVLSGFDTKPVAVFHSFGGSTADVERILKTGNFYFGINGIVTFKNSKLRETLPAIPRDRLVLETDSPYLAPVPFRGKRNESAYIVNTAQVVANTLGCPVEELAEKAFENAQNLFAVSK